MARVEFVDWLQNAGSHGTQPDRDAIVDWIGRHLGKRYRARAGYVVAVLDPDQASQAIRLAEDALGSDFPTDVDLDRDGARRAVRRGRPAVGASLTGADQPPANGGRTSTTAPWRSVTL